MTVIALSAAALVLLAFVLGALTATLVRGLRRHEKANGGPTYQDAHTKLARYVEPVPVVLEPAADDAGRRNFLSALTAFFRAAKAPAAPVREQVILGRPREHVTAPPDWQAAAREVEGSPLPRDKGCIARQKALEIERDQVARGLLDPHLASGGDERARIDRALGFASKRKEREQGDI